MFLGENVEPETALSDLTVLIFEVDGHRYALPTRAVQEILRAALPTRLAQAPHVIEGILNVRGRIAAILDIRTRFELPQRALRASDVLILCEVGHRLLLLRVDAIIDILSVSASVLADVQSVGPTATHARGIITLSDGLLLIVDIERFLNDAEQAALGRALAAFEAAGAAP